MITTESAINRDHPPPLRSPASTSSDPPALVDVSSSDSNSDFDYTSCHCPTYSTMSITEYQQASTTKPPVLTPGTVSPEQLRMWEMGCLQYFHHKMISAADQVQYVAWGLHDPRIQQWYAIDAGCLNILDFTSFMAELRNYWLPTDWAADLRLKMLSSHQGSHPFHEWVIDVQTQNTMLANHDGHMNDQGLRFHFEANMNKDLALQYRSSDARTEVALRFWVKKVKKLDEKRLRDARILRETIEMSLRPGFKNRPSSDPDRKPKPFTSGPPAGSPSSSSPRLPALTDDECKILRDNSRCFKCCLPFQSHTSHDCPNGFPNAATYKSLSLDDVKRLQKKSIANKTSVAAVESEELVAVIMPSAALGDGTDSGDECVTPVSSPHLIWKCAVDGPSTSQPVTIDALIDDGSSLVLIEESLVVKLGLRRHSLPRPLSVGMALPSSRCGDHFHLDTFVNLSLSSLDFHFCSLSVCAVVAPSLCKPVILGLPFLRQNKIVIDHDTGSCIAKDSNYDLLHPPPLAPAPRITPSLDDICQS